MTNREQQKKMEKITEICLCHGEEWVDRVELLKHQLHHYQQQQKETTMKVAWYRAALEKSGRDPEKLLQERKQLEETERTLQTERMRFLEEKEKTEQLLQLRIGHTQERVMAMEAWEVRLGHREEEVQDAEFRRGYEFPGT